MAERMHEIMSNEKGLVTLFEQQKNVFQSGVTYSLAFRREQLKQLSHQLQKWEPHLLAALDKDLGKTMFEGYATELGIVHGEIKEALRHLGKWSRVRRSMGPFVQFPSQGRRYPEPKGCVLIVSPWNYPVQLTLAPLVSAMAAGCCAILSLPPDAPETSSVLTQMIADGFPEGYITTAIGTIPQNTELFSLPFDHIFFTGSPRVGKIVMTAAAQNLTPVTLELGGKSPCIVEEGANLELAARRIVWGKCLNAGQTCVAPDYLLVQDSVKAELIARMQAEMQRQYPINMVENPEYPRIINEKHFDRLCGLMQNQKILFGGQADRDIQKIQLTLLDEPDLDSPVMQEEIFGPLLPVISYHKLEDALHFIASRPKPLACYLFTNNRKKARYIFSRLSFGGGCLNDTIVHLTSSKLPFGGIGNSGMGSCHGRAGFETFTHWKSVLERSDRIDMAMRYPPYGEKFYILKKFMR